MKTTMKSFKKVLMTLVAVSALSVLSGFNTTVKAEPMAMLSDCCAGGVCDEEVISYLENLGYTNVVILRVLPGGDRVCSASHEGQNVYIYVNIEDGKIISSEEIAQ